MRKLMFVLVGFFLFLPVMAAVQDTTQTPPASVLSALDPQPPATPDGPGPLDMMLKEVFGFTDAQLIEFHALLVARGLAVEAVSRLIQPVERALAEAVNATPPNPVQVGTLYLTLDNLRRQREAVNETFRTDFGSLLTAEQQQLLDEIHRLQLLLHAGNMLQQIGL